ncbi:GNAT family N-acetyltransferase [Brasilonema octagenarum UFV-E1]|uniref:GNAT family N-acetyltransferase n=2 Tax=Brasilonema TaxID=383614 RepID=A0A856MMP3_9CYAN|nr:MULTISPECIES: GNAT family N-acetyltransferase [Brasilonema]NMF67309.1 GNAT family N-acetyltransferase [Brasilonema octagenarum UFV-OR1]QDL11360.1 GNAT family N-acetyltransferase [Brasilonema sennae CENA114]QDL17702.1 GNAT family N-acetyltransferase [Brasilonema octagenarum UFV-E1]QDL17751.1 GNAT family N-acetyltransferase [Brasilonema octagenarum UFV-E1]
MKIAIREATQQEDSLIAKHFYHMSKDIGVADDAINPDWLDIIVQFIEQARQDLFYKAFVAEVEGVIVGSTSCQLYTVRGLYPNILKQQFRKTGYIWGVYVEPAYRRQGIAKQLISTTVNYLKEIGCTRVRLDASTMGQPVYESLGFSSGNAMQLDLIDTAFIP